MRAVWFEGLDWEKENERSKRGSEYRKALKRKSWNRAMNSLKNEEELEVMYIWLKGLAEDNGHFYELYHDNNNGKGLIFKALIIQILGKLGQLPNWNADTIIGAEDLFASLQIIHELPQEEVMEILRGDEMSTPFLRAMFIPKTQEETSSSHTISSISTGSFGTDSSSETNTNIAVLFHRDLFRCAASQMLDVAFGACHNAEFDTSTSWEVVATCFSVKDSMVKELAETAHSKWYGQLLDDATPTAHKLDDSSRSSNESIDTAVKFSWSKLLKSEPRCEKFATTLFRERFLQLLKDA